MATSKTSEVDDRTNEKEDQVPKKIGKAHRGAPRGKKSWRAKDDKFRERVGAKTIAENRTRIEAKTFSELDVVLTQLTNLCLNAEPVTAQLPVTTRGLGMMVKMSYQMALMQLRQPPTLTLNAFYRLSLAQLHLQMIKASYERKGQMTVEKLKARDLISPFYDFDSIVMSHPATLKAISALIDTIGVVEHQTTKYFPVIPQSGVIVLGRSEPTRKRQAVASTSNAEEVPTVLATTRGPDPFTVTFTSLREDVVFLSSAETSEEARRFFWNHSPLPGARWDDERYLLLNPDDIMPPNYTASDLRNEMREMDAFVDRLVGKNSYLVGSCSFTGKGTISQLTTSYVSGRISDIPPVEAFLTTEFVGSPFDIGNQQLLLGLYSLVGEFPPYPQPHLGYSMRYQPLCGRNMPADWNAVADTFVKRHA